MYETDNIYTIKQQQQCWDLCLAATGWMYLRRLLFLPTSNLSRNQDLRMALTGIYLKLGTTTLYAGDLTYAYLDELAGLYSDYPGYNTNAVFDQKYRVRL